MQNLGEVLFLRDQALLQYHFSKIGEEGVQDLLNPTPPTDTQLQRGDAFKRFIRQYGLNPEEQVTEEAALEFLAAFRAGRVPRWVGAVAPIHDIKRAAGEVSK